jgi:hypothetical protein
MKFVVAGVLGSVCAIVFLVGSVWKTVDSTPWGQLQGEYHNLVHTLEKQLELNQVFAMKATHLHMGDDAMLLSSPSNQNPTCPSVFLPAYALDSSWKDHIVVGHVVNCTKFQSPNHDLGDEVVMKTLREKPEVGKIPNEIRIYTVLTSEENKHIESRENGLSTMQVAKPVFMTEEALAIEKFTSCNIARYDFSEASFADFIITLTNFLHHLQQKFRFMHRDLHRRNICYHQYSTSTAWYLLDFDFSHIEIQTEGADNETVTEIVDDWKGTVWGETFNPSYDLRFLMFRMMERDEDGWLVCRSFVPETFACPVLLELLDPYENATEEGITRWYGIVTNSLFDDDDFYWEAEEMALKNEDPAFTPVSVRDRFLDIYNAVAMQESEEVCGADPRDER